jgi:formylglycine-generating enzyme
MAIVFSCQCGKDFNAKDELAGKRARCPQCRREFRVPKESIFGPVELTTSDSLSPSASSTIPPVLPVQVADDAVPGMEEAERMESVSVSRPVWRDPLLLYGGGIPLLGLLVFFGYVAWPHIRNSHRPNPLRKQGTLGAKPASLDTLKVATNSIGMKLTPIPAGEFEMGSREDADAMEWEKPRHHVRITQAFYIGAYEVTRGQFRLFADEAGYLTEAEKDGRGGFGWDEQTGRWNQAQKYSWRNTGFDQTDDHPVVNVTWNDAVAFAAWLSRKETMTYRLPTEAEWEYACRAGTTSDYSFGDDPEVLASTGNVVDATLTEKFPNWHIGEPIKARDGFVFTAPVGAFRPNAFGVFDMHGNVAELCSDAFREDYYKNSPTDDPEGASSAEARALRGGSWRYDHGFARSADRNGQSPTVRSNEMGLTRSPVPRTLYPRNLESPDRRGRSLFSLPAQSHPSRKLSIGART